MVGEQINIIVMEIDSVFRQYLLQLNDETEALNCIKQAYSDWEVDLFMEDFDISKYYN